MSGWWLPFGIFPSGTYNPFQRIHVSSEVHRAYVYTYREQRVYRPLGLVPLRVPEHLTLCLALSGHWPEPLHNLLARTPLPTCSLPPASIHDVLLCLRQGEARSNTRSTVPEDRSYGKGRRRHSCCPAADVPLLCRSGGQHPSARSASTTRSHDSTETSTKLTVHFIWQNTSRLVRKCTPSIHFGETLQNQRASRAKSRVLSTSLRLIREESPTRDDTKTYVPSFGTCSTCSYAGQRCCCQ